MNNQPKQKIVQLKNVEIQYGKGAKTFSAARDISFDVASGETLGLVGESGSGKTTIGRAIQGLQALSSGQINLLGTELTDIKKNPTRFISQFVQTIFQDPFGSMNPAKNIASTIAEPLLVHQARITRDELNRAVGDALAKVGLSPDAGRRYPTQFSGGQLQRIAIARAIITKPKLVICDEAVSALDLSIQAQILNLLADIQEEFNVSYLFITHDLSIVRHFAQRVIVLRRGEIVDSFDSNEINLTTRTKYTQRLFEAAPVPDPEKQAQKRLNFEKLEQED